MRLAVRGDIHSNHAALRACLASALSLGSEAFLLLGDYVSDCACPEKTLALLRALSSRFPCRFVAGNREEYMLNHLDGADDGWRSPSSASGSLLFTFRRLARRDFDFFRSLPIAGRFDVPGFPALEYCHGSPLNTRGNLAFGSQDAKDILASLSSDLLVCAHTHIQGEYTHAGKRLVNPVSVGIPWRRRQSPVCRAAKRRRPVGCDFFFRLITQGRKLCARCMKAAFTARPAYGRG